MSKPKEYAKLVDPVVAYDALAPYYKEISARRKRYLDAVEQIIASYTQGSDSLLDIGAGDSVRTLRIARRSGIRHVVVVEPSQRMRAQAPETISAWGCKAHEIPETDLRFDVVTCLWNVLGHVKSTEERVSVLTRAKALLSSTGAIFIDVNHRYNAVQYGWPATLWRVLRDRLSWSDERGNVTVTWKVAGALVRTSGHVFRRAEIEDIFKRAMLSITNHWTLSYEHGTPCRSSFHGNFLYRLVPAERSVLAKPRLISRSTPYRS